MPIDPHSATWSAVVANTNTELARLTTALEVTGHDLAQTENLRGQIAALRRVVGWADATPDTPLAVTNYGV